MKEKYLRLVLLCAIFCFVPSFFAAQSGLGIISPVEGIWANKQALVLDVPDSCEVFYSFTGSDPLNFGFAYDGPVLIDADGSVPLRIALVSADGSVEQFKVSYTVRRPDVSWQLPFDETQPLFVYSPGDTLPVPEEFLYCLGDSTAPDIPGRALVLSGDFFPERYIPCTVTDGLFSWRFVIATENASATNDAGSSAGLEEENILPFIVSDWNYITFNQPKLIYSIDDSYWEEAKGSVFLDRSVPHTIYWQSVAYEPDNPVYSFRLPAKPVLDTSCISSSAAVFEPGEGYTVSLQGSGMKPSDIFCVDAFYGEEFSGDFTLEVYYEGIYQGDVPFSVSIDKKPPERPVVQPSTDLFYNRNSVTIDFLYDAKSELRYSVSLLAEKASGFSELELATGKGSGKLPQNDFKKYDGTPLLLDSSKGNAVLYSVSACSVDSFGNASAPVEYQVIIDPYNYYVSDSSTVSVQSDGSLARPFSSLEDALASVGTEGFKRIHLDGIFTLSSDMVLSSHYELHGVGNGSGLRVNEGDSVIVAPGAQVAFTNCVLELTQSDKPDNESPSFFIVDNASVAFAACELVASFEGSGTVFTADSSTVSLDDCGVSIRSGRYASLFSGVRTNLSVTGGRYTAVAPTAVIFSLSAGMFDLSESECRVFANLGRVAELSGVSASVVDNVFFAELQGDSAATARVSPLWHDGRSKFTRNEGNSVSGFPGGSH